MLKRRGGSRHLSIIIYSLAFVHRVLVLREDRGLGLGAAGEGDEEVVETSGVAGVGGVAGEEAGHAFGVEGVLDGDHLHIVDEGGDGGTDEAEFDVVPLVGGEVVGLGGGEFGAGAGVVALLGGIEVQEPSGETRK